ncbi:MAG: hypothetical protein QE484_14845 [Rhizobium sp.]|nr:hypothetical protein [Rhizobium sp.]
MPSTPVDPITQQIDALLASAGLMVPPDLKVGVYSEAKDLLIAVQLLRSPRPAAVEPSNIFSLVQYAVLPGAPA